MCMYSTRSLISTLHWLSAHTSRRTQQQQQQNLHLLINQASMATRRQAAQRDSSLTQTHSPDMLLPEPVLISILEHVPLQERLSCCALVCRAWASAVALSSKSVELSQPAQSTIDKLQAWLQRCGGQVTSIKSQHSDAVLQLPCSRLSRLQSLIMGFCCALTFDGVRSGSGSSSGAHHGAAAASPRLGLLPSLQQLQLHACNMPLGSFKELSQLTSLSTLSLTGPFSTTDDNFMPRTDVDTFEVVCELLQHLPSLTALHLYFRSLNPPQLSNCLSTMQHLQRLEVGLLSTTNNEPVDISLAALRTSLTALRLASSQVGRLKLSASMVPGCLQTSNHLLQQLQLSNVVLDPATLHHCTNLQLLSLQRFSVNNAGGTAEQGWQALFGAVGRLTKLQHLELYAANESGRAIADPSWFTALTASCQLTWLCLEASSVLGGMPAQALEHMLPAGKQLPHLQQLALFSGDADDEELLDAADISRIAVCCPALQQLVLFHVIGADAVSSLTQLQPHLTYLWVGGEAVNQASAVTAVAQLTSLKSLTWGAPGDQTWKPLSGLQPLTALQGLTNLKLYRSHGSLVFDKGHQLPDVYQQLQRLCAT